MPKVSDAHRESRREQILDAALACVRERGFGATSMADIITASGLSAGAIYSYFPGKRELVTAVAKRALGGRIAQLQGGVDAGPVPRPALMVRGLLQGLEAEGVPPSILVQMWGEAATEPEFRHLVRESIGAFFDGFRRYLAAWAVQDRGLSEADADDWAGTVLPAVLALGQGCILQSVLLPGFDAERYVAAIDALLPASGE